LPHVDDVEAEVLKAIGNIFRWGICGKATDYCLDGLFRILGEGKILEIIFIPTGFYG
jgi:hypothetical protein